jgi:hypothetical protein
MESQAEYLERWLAAKLRRKAVKAKTSKVDLREMQRRAPHIYKVVHYYIQEDGTIPSDLPRDIADRLEGYLQLIDAEKHPEVEPQPEPPPAPKVVAQPAAQPVPVVTAPPTPPSQSAEARIRLSRKHAAEEAAASHAEWKPGDPLPVDATKEMLRLSSVSEVKAWVRRKRTT